MDTIFIAMLAILFILAISDLVIGVSNDAVNFLNSALGSKAAPFWLIMIIASLGIMFGATFSSGMMEVARKGIFHPGMFYFSEIMIIFLAVMLTDILLLDIFNTFGMPTSTTVSIVFELLGAAVAVALVKVMADPTGASVVMDYINSGKALAIITGILLSVVIAFSVGAFVQYLARVLFTFNTEKTYKYFGSLWGGFAIAAITYFILIKGAKGSSFINKETLAIIKENTWLILVASFAGWTLILQIIGSIFKFNIFKVIVLVGTFALAMAFAGNDLVNFIGVPLAALEAWKAFKASGATDPYIFEMGGLAAKVATPTIYLLIAGIVMVLTLWISKKARSVTETGINLSRQDAGYERFGSTSFSRAIVRSFVNMNNAVTKVVPQPVLAWVGGRFDQSKAVQYANPDDAPAFDMLRASVNLVVASILISIGTSLGLPLSTTYVTFMVAMGTSMSDGAWGRESAVFRVTGVVSVIGGWFLTALAAFTVAFVIANILNWFGIYAVVSIFLLAVFALWRTNKVHKTRADADAKRVKEETVAEESDIIENSRMKVLQTLTSAKSVFKQSLIGLTEESARNLKKNSKQAEELNDVSANLKLKIHKTIDKLQDQDIESGHHYVQVIDYLREVSKCATAIARDSYDYVDNNHPKLSEKQLEELGEIEKDIRAVFNDIITTIESDDNIKRSKAEELNKTREILVEDIDKARKAQLKRIKKKVHGTRNTMFYLGVLSDAKNMVMDASNLLEAYQRFEQYMYKD